MEWLFKKAEEFLRRHKFIRRWRKVLAVMMAMVVFMSTYAMVLPAITLETGEGAEIGLFADSSGDESVPDGSTVTDSIPEAGAEGAALTTETAVIEDTAPAETAPVENVSTENAPAENTPAEPEAAETAPTEAAPTEAAPTEAVPTEAAPTATETPAPQVEEVSATPEEPKYLDNEKLVFENNSLKLTLTVPAAAKVVKGATLDVREIGQPFANDGLDENGRKNEYLSYLAAAETALNLTAEEITYIEKNIVNTPAAELPWARFFAISIKNADGAIIAPACTLPVEIIYKNTAETAADGLKVMCLLPNGTMTMIGSETRVATAAQTPIALLSAADSNFDITSKFVDAGTLTFGTFAVQVSEVDAAIEKEKEEAAKAAAEAAKAESAPTSDASAAESVESVPADESAAESTDESQEESLPADESLEESLPADESTDESLDESLPADESADESLDESLPEEAEDESLAEEAEKAEDETEAEEEPKADDKATKTLVTKGADYTVTMTYTADAKIPAGAILSAKEILPTAYNYKGYMNKAVDALGLSEDEAAYARARFFDIKIMLGTAEVIPEAPVRVDIEYKTPQELASAENMKAVHFGNEGPEEVVIADVTTDEMTSEVSGVAFDTGSFSVYGVVYTVDFEYEVDGKTYKFSLPGGGFVSFTDLVEVLGIIGDTNAEENGDENGSVVVENTEENSINEGTEENGINSDPNTALTLGDVEVSAAAKAFVADVTSVEFSSPSLVDVSKVENETTVGQIKEDRKIECRYSAELTEEQIAEINAQTVEAGDWALISVQPFTSEESLTVTMKNGEVFTIQVTDAQIRKTVIDAKGDTWEITVTYGEDAQIPDGAWLSVREILSTDEEYDSLCQSAAEEACSDAEGQGIENPLFSGARLFDIEIQSENGKIEPSAPVQVSIRLIDKAAADHTSVVHFEEGGARVLTAQIAETNNDEMRKAVDNANETAESETPESTENTENEANVTEISFQTDSFSVYSVVNVTDFSSVVGSGKKYALVTGIAHDPGATTGYGETWGSDYFTIIVNAHAMTDQHLYDNQNQIDGLKVSPVHTWEDGSVSYVGGDPAQWQFEDAGNGKYYLSVNGKYLQRFNKAGYNHQYGWEAKLVDNKNDATPLSITVNTDGTILIYDDRGQGQQYYLHNEGESGGNEWKTRVYKFRNTEVDTNSKAYRFRLCEESDKYDSFAARKVSVQNLTINNRFLIYRKFEDSQGNEQLFALASDGTFVRVYDGGDTVYWRETDKNLYWNYRLEGNYYSIYSTNPLTNKTVYINPMHSSEPPQMITEEPSRLTLIGKDNGEYGTAIENWDQTAYDYAGLHVTVNDQGEASLSTGTRVAGTSDQFLFAVDSNMPGGTAETVDTVDSNSLGIKITMFDYGQAKGTYSAGDKLKEMTDVAGSDEYTPHKAHALVKKYLENGLPSSNTNGAMAGLFTAGGSAVTAYKENVNHLFLQSYYDENGMFRYRSEDNYAYLPYNPDTQTITGTDFTVYRQAATPYPDDVAPGHTYYTHGHFMPYNDIDMTQNVSRLMNQYGNDYQNGQAIGELPVGDGRSYEDIYGVQGIPNFYTGMKMEAKFSQPKDGRLENGDDMAFKFTGDDDMWVYIDGVLVLDIGGIHEPLSGSIDFSTGQVVNPSGSSLAGTTNLKTIFDNALAELQGIPEGQRTQEQTDMINRISSIEWKRNTFADYTNHDFKAFYMERGAGASNLDIQFNLKVTLTDEFVVGKQIPEDIDPRFVNHEYKFQALYIDKTDNNTEKPLFAGAVDSTNNAVCTKVLYKDRRDEDGRPIEVPVSVDNNGYFTLKAGEAAVFKMADETIEYTVKEVEIDAEKTEQVEINGQVVDVSSGTAETAYARVSDRSQLNYKNHPILQNLNIIKHLLPENTQAGPGDVFEFRVYLETTTEVDGETVRQLVPYSYGPYYVTKIVEGQTHYYTLTGTNNAPKDKGTDPVVCSTTGRSGSINSIPPEFTVVIPNLAVGTHFYIEERRDNIPSGYVFDHEDLIPGSYETQTLGTEADIISRILARDEKDHQAFDHNTVGKIKKGTDAQSEIFNRKVYVNVQKQWLRTNGQPYTLEEARTLPGSTSAVITAELWKKKTNQEPEEETDTPVTVTFMVKTSTDSDYRQVSVPITIKKNSALEFSLGANKTSQADEIHTDTEYSISRTSVSSSPKIQYSNGRQKDRWNKYTISGIAEDTTVYATFDAAKVSDDFVGLYIAAMEEPGASEAPAEEKVADITLNNSNDWLQQFPMESGYTYFLMNAVETGLGENAHRYTFIDAPTVTWDANKNLILAVANKYREPIDITVEKVWSPALTSEEEASAYVKVELHRYAKKTKGILEVVLKDNFGAPIEGAVFKLYKDGAEQQEEYITDVNGKVTANGLEPGTYYFKQISTPEGYSMPDAAPQTEDFVVADDTIEQQKVQYVLQNTALETNGVATLTLVDNNGDPIKGAKYNLLKKEGGNDVVVKEGLETGEDGKITVGQLKAGTYFFYETEPPADYNLPDNWQNTDFTVLEHPGTVQYFNISMTNDLKGRGFVNINLTGPDGQAISGAGFELYKDSEKVGEGQTGPDGTLTFGDSERLHVGTYYVRQVTTAQNLLPASQQSFTIHDDGNANQENTLAFTNAYRGMGTASVTLTRKDDNSPISGAEFQLYKDGELLATATTDSNGQLAFGTSDNKLSAGNYSIRQVSTVEGLEPVVNNWPFEVLENGNPNQTFSWNVQNEENAGNVTIKLWRKQGLGQYNWEEVAVYNNLKRGKTYDFSAELNPGLYAAHCWYLLDERADNYYRDLQAHELTGIGAAGTWDSTNNTYHFSITPGKDNTTYSYVLATDWGTNDIRSMKMDEASRQAAAPSTGRFGNQQSGKLTVPKARLLSAGDPSARTDLGDQSGTLAADSGDMTPSNGDSGGVSFRAAAAAVNPSGPPNDDYIDDSSFSESYTIRKSDNWKHVFDDLDKCDQDENPYYYYVVEKECVPDSYHISSYRNDNLSETGTITITNEKRLGELTIRKSVTVNGGNVPDDNKTVADGTYTFTITGPGSYSESRTITVTNGVAESDIVLSELKEGQYTISETGSTNTNGMSLAESQTVTVSAGAQASTNVVSFTNNLATASIEIIKVEKGHKDSGHTLSGAKFQLTRVDRNGNNVSGSGAYQSEIQTVDPTTGKTTFTGLFPGSRYKLEEKEAPAGYILVETPWYITVDANGTAMLTATYTMASAAENDNSFYIENEPGAALPNTGGSGTTPYAVGGSLILAFTALAYIFRKRRFVLEAFPKEEHPWKGGDPRL